MNTKNRLYTDGYFVRSRYWKQYKESLPVQLSKKKLFEVTLGLILGDANFYKTKNSKRKK